MWWVKGRWSAGHGRVQWVEVQVWCGFAGFEEMMTATEPTEWSGGGWLLRPTHIFSDFSGIFYLGLTLCFFKKYAKL